MMFKRFFNLFQLDLKLAIRSKFHFVVLFLAALSIIVINFVIPKEVKINTKEILLDLSEERSMESFLLNQGSDKERFYNSLEQLNQALIRDKNTLGVVMEGSLKNPKFQIIYQGTEPYELVNILGASVEQMVNDMSGNIRPSSYEIRYLREKSQPIPFNVSMVPLMMILEVVMFGFIVIAVMVFQEKDQGSIRAYRITPSGTLEYILSKVLVNVLLALVYGGLIILFTVSPSWNLTLAFLLIILTSFLMSILGLIVSMFFRNLSEFIFPGLIILFIFALPITSYLFPSFAPEFIKWIPSYPVSFGIREALFPTGKAGYLEPMFLMLFAESIILLALSYLGVKRRLMREGR